MSTAGAIKAGRCFIEILADDTGFTRTLKTVHNRMAALSHSLRQVGTQIALGAAALGLPMVLAARKAAEFEDALLELKASVSDLSPDQLRAVREESLRLSREMGVAPAKIAQAFALLVKAGMSVEDALNGAARSAVEFARVSGVEAAQAAEFMKVAMNVFGISAEEAANTLSAAADSSETSIASMIESFALVASVARGTNQSLFSLSQGLAVLARFGIKGEEAGTGIKTFLVKLLSPADDAREALASLGLSMESFVDESGKMLPLPQIAQIFADKLKGMDKSARAAMLTNEALIKVFDVRGIRVIHAFAAAGEQGFNDIASAMEGSLSVSDKFSIMMEGLTGAFERVKSAVERLAIAFGTGLSPVLSVLAHGIAFVIDVLSWLLNGIPILSPIIAGLTAVTLGLGLAMVVVGWGLAAVTFGMKSFLRIGPLFSAMTVTMTGAVTGLATAVWGLAAAFYALPVIGQIALILTGVAAIGVGLWYWMSSAQKKADQKKKTGIKRDEFRKPLDAAGAERGNTRGGETIGTFHAAMAGQLGIGPKLADSSRTAAATERTADAVESLLDLQQGEHGGALPAGGVGSPNVPSAEQLNMGVSSVSPAVRGVAARADKDLIDVAERTALASERAVTLLREILAHQGTGGMAFA
jgi:TP901 family phage tail tape measure protein